MKNITLVLIFFFAFFSITKAQDISGPWYGTLKVQGTGLPLVFHIKDSAGVLSATMDSPDQNATGIPATAITFSNPDLHIEVANGAIVYEGKVINNDSIKGTFQQNGMSFPLNLYRTKLNHTRPQKPKPPFPYKNEEVSFRNSKAGIKLAGTLTIPKEGKVFPAVILISGSGPQDRDETIMGHKPFLVIADYLSRRGIAALRYDDRGTAKSEGDFAASTTADFATDVEAAIRFLKQNKKINPQKIGLIGHSEGAIIAPMVASKDSSIDFIVLLAGPGYDGADLLLMQNEAMGKASGMTEEQLAKAKKLNKNFYQIVLEGKEDSITRKKLAKEFLESTNYPEDKKKEMVSHQVDLLTSPWMHYFLQNDPADYLEKVHCPVLALDGSKDLQVPPERNIAAIKKALNTGGNKNVSTKIFPGLNHLFQEAKTGLPQEYSEIAQTFSPKVLKYMASWITEQVK